MKHFIGVSEKKLKFKIFTKIQNFYNNLKLKKLKLKQNF